MDKTAEGQNSHLFIELSELSGLELNYDLYR